MSVDVEALELTDIIFDQTSEPNEPVAGDFSVSFDAFADWYTYGGHATMPWLELLDLSKWKPSAPSLGVNNYSSNELGAMPSGVSGRSRKQSFLGGDENVQFTASHPVNPAVFEFVISSSGSKLHVFAKDIEIVADTVTLSGFRERSVDEIHGIFSSMQPVQRLSLQQFEACVLEILTLSNAKRMESDEFEFVSAVLAGVFHSLELREAGENEGTVAVDELVAGTSIFVGQGTKSEKLASIFDVFDSNEAGLVSKRTLWRYLYAILASLSQMTEIIPGTDVPSSSMATDDLKFNHVVEEAIDELIEYIFEFRNGQEGEDADGAFGDSLISFDTFAQWYTNGGYEVCAWLELLDHSKWIPMPKVDTTTGTKESYTKGLQAASIAQAANQPRVLYTLSVKTQRA